MKLERLHIFNDDDWTLITEQFHSLFAETFEFVTENKGTRSEARDIYVTSFLYYTQLLELHGMQLHERAPGIVYSFARCLWIKNLRKRKVDTNFVTHRREFFEMEHAFHEIDSIAERSTKTADKLAEVGEPARTLILDYIGKGFCLNEVGNRLGFSDEERAQQTVVKSLRKVIVLTEGVDFQMNDEEFEKGLRYILDSPAEPELENHTDKVSLAMISRSVAMIKNYVVRNKRMEVFKDIEIDFEPIIPDKVEHKQAIRKRQRMKPAVLIFTTAIVALVVSLLTAFSWMELNGPIDQEVEVNIVPSEPIEVVEEEEIPIAPAHNYTAFAINNDGYLVTTADAVKSKNSVRLEGNGSNRNLKAEVVLRDTVSNLALLKCAFESGTKLPYRFSPENPVLGQAVYTLGFPHDNMFYAMGQINAVSSEQKGQVKMDDFLPGSPIICDKGQLLGVVTGRDEEEMLTGVTYVSVIKEMIEKAEENGLGQIELQSRNRLFHSHRIAQIDAYTPFLWKIK